MEAELITDIWTIIQVILLDLALGGDNSIVIGMAAKNLPHELQKKLYFTERPEPLCYAFLWP